MFVLRQIAHILCILATPTLGLTLEAGITRFAKAADCGAIARQMGCIQRSERPLFIWTRSIPLPVAIWPRPATRSWQARPITRAASAACGADFSLHVVTI